MTTPLAMKIFEFLAMLQEGGPGFQRGDEVPADSRTRPYLRRALRC
jgi:hypothetical protein